MKRLFQDIILTALILAPLAARADVNLDDIAPKLTKCWGTTCLMPDASVNATMFNIDTKKWEAGVVALGGGAMLLFAADQDYGSGLCAHLTGKMSQETGQNSFAMWSAGAVFLRYLEVSYTRTWLSDGPASQYISVAGNIPWDVFTRATMPNRARAAQNKDGRIPWPR